MHFFPCLLYFVFLKVCTTFFDTLMWRLTILLDRSAGSIYESFVDSMINMLDSSYIAMAERFAESMPGKRVNKPMLHWLTHVQINAFVHMMQHEKDKQSALHFISPVMDLLIKSWMKYALEDDE